MIALLRRLFCRHPTPFRARTITWGGKNKGITERTESCMKCGKTWNLVSKDEIEIKQA